MLLFIAQIIGDNTNQNYIKQSITMGKNIINPSKILKIT